MAKVIKCPLEVGQVYQWRNGWGQPVGTYKCLGVLPKKGSICSGMVEEYLVETEIIDEIEWDSWSPPVSHAYSSVKGNIRIWSKDILSKRVKAGQFIPIAPKRE